MSKQGQRLNLKWSIGDIDRVVARAKIGLTAAEICAQLEGTSLASDTEEIISLCNQSSVPIKRGTSSNVSKPVAQKRLVVAKALRRGDRVVKQVAHDCEVSTLFVYDVVRDFGIALPRPRATA